MAADLEHDSFVDSVIVFIKGALVFTVSQAWNSAIQDLIEKSEFFSKYGKVVYALVITLAAVYTLKVIVNLRRLLDVCRHNLTPECFNWQKILIGGNKQKEYKPPE